MLNVLKIVEVLEIFQSFVQNYKIFKIHSFVNPYRGNIVVNSLLKIFVIFTSRRIGFS